MTHHMLRITDHFARLLDSGTKTAELRIDNRDFQAGDIISWYDTEGNYRRWMERRTITHVLKNYQGLDHGYVVLSLDDTRLGYWKQEALDARAERDEFKRSAASLRGQITKLRRKFMKRVIKGDGTSVTAELNTLPVGSIITCDERDEDLVYVKRASGMGFDVWREDGRSHPVDSEHIARHQVPITVTREGTGS